MCYLADRCITQFKNSDMYMAVSAAPSRCLMNQFEMAGLVDQKGRGALVELE